jgi:hypothetical protein
MNERIDSAGTQRSSQRLKRCSLMPTKTGVLLADLGFSELIGSIDLLVTRGRVGNACCEPLGFSCRLHVFDIAGWGVRVAA